ncbi:leucine-rich repeat LGI family member 4-like [Catharus ustulatus]|uniref:leucine-rich repeat LGI family member 4-like n=1 Tax=Catharus ustulatus TaxID=91951 RepID=UPI00140940B9|nr:leucine-rich repeat LGI family member 4-like [Catharus ustulatus]
MGSPLALLPLLLLLGGVTPIFEGIPIFGAGLPKGGGACPGGCACDRDGAWCRGGRGRPPGAPPALGHALPDPLGHRGPAPGELPAPSRADPAPRHLGPFGIHRGRSLRGTGGTGVPVHQGLPAGLHCSLGSPGALIPEFGQQPPELLPLGLFQDLGTLSQLDLRGKPWRCDCGLRWLLAWLGARPSPTGPEGGGRCRGPLPHQGTPLALLSPRQLQCQRHGSSPVACHPLAIGDTLLLVVAQVGGGSWVWRRSGGPSSPFIRHQALGSGQLHRPHAVTAACLGGHLYLGVAPAPCSAGVPEGSTCTSSCGHGSATCTWSSWSWAGARRSWCARRVRSQALLGQG